MSGCNEASNFDPAATSGFSALPEQWALNDVAASLIEEPLLAQVATSFDSIEMMRAGSLVGIATRFTQALNGGQADIIVMLNGIATALLVVHTNAINSTGGVATAAIGAIPYVAGDLVSVAISTTAALFPITTDCEAWVQVFEE